MHSSAPSSRRVHHPDDSSGSDDDSDTEFDPARPWLAEFNSYFRTHDVVPENMSIITWRGVSVYIF
jgi:hypothetical protein